MVPSAHSSIVQPVPSPVAVNGLGPVLLVDDDDAVRNVTRGMLERLGCRVFVARDGFEALARYDAEREHIRLVLLDLSMPGMDGVEVLRELRLHDPELRVVLMSGYAGPGFDERLQPGELAGFLQKPYSLAALCQALVAAFEERSPGHRGTGLPST